MNSLKKGNMMRYMLASQNIKITYDDIKDEPCAHHSKLGKCTHTNRQCRLNADIKKDPDAGFKAKQFKRKNRKDKKEQKDNEESASELEDQEPKHKRSNKFPRVETSLVTFLATPSAKKEKAAWRELNATMPEVPQYLNWSEHPSHGTATIILIIFHRTQGITRSL